MPIILTLLFSLRVNFLFRSSSSCHCAGILSPSRESFKCNRFEEFVIGRRAGSDGYKPGCRTGYIHSAQICRMISGMIATTIAGCARRLPRLSLRRPSLDHCWIIINCQSIISVAIVSAQAYSPKWSRSLRLTGDSQYRLLNGRL